MEIETRIAHEAERELMLRIPFTSTSSVRSKIKFHLFPKQTRDNSGTSAQRRAKIWSQQSR